MSVAYQFSSEYVKGGAVDGGKRRMLMIGGAACRGSTKIPAVLDSRYDDTAFSDFALNQMPAAHGYAVQSDNFSSSYKVMESYKSSDGHAVQWISLAYHTFGKLCQRATAGGAGLTEWR